MSAPLLQTVLAGAHPPRRRAASRTAALAAALLVATLALPASARAPEAALRQAYLDAVTPLVGDTDAEVRVTDLRPSRPDVWRRARRLRAFQLQTVARPYGTLSARVEVDVPGGVESLSVTARVDVMVDVWVALVGAAELARRPLAGLPNTAFRGTALLEGERATRPIVAGAVLTRLNAVAPVAVARGQRVALVAVVGEVSVRAEGMALRAGRVGDAIPVRAPGGAVIDTLVSGPGRVEVLR